jgi:hypothetical protein
LHKMVEPKVKIRVARWVKNFWERHLDTHAGEGI